MTKKVENWDERRWLLEQAREVIKAYLFDQDFFEPFVRAQQRFESGTYMMLTDLAMMTLYAMGVPSGTIGDPKLNAGLVVLDQSGVQVDPDGVDAPDLVWAMRFVSAVALKDEDTMTALHNTLAEMHYDDAGDRIEALVMITARLAHARAMDPS